MEPSTPQSSASSVAIPVAIVLGFGLIALAIYFSGGGSSAPRVAEQQATANTTGQEVTGNIRPIDESDHIRGNPNAPIMLVEYSDFDCPFCKNFHDTMKKLLDEYGVNGDVAWVYRHFPIQQLHPNAPVIAQASECVAELGGNDAFWTFSDLVFNERGVNEPTSMVRLPEFAETAGVDRAQYETCMASDRHQDKIMADLEDGANAGVRGTPHTIILVGDQQAVINGAQPYSTVEGIIDSLIAQLEGREVPGETETAPAS